MDPHDDARDRILGALRDEEAGLTAYVVGGTDAGKTTVARALAEGLAQDRATAVVDADPGQAWLGPPTCVSVAWAGAREPLATRFVGDVTPAGHMLQTLTGVARLVARAREEGAEAVVVDSSGYVGSEPARAFQYHVIDLLEPRHLVVMGTGEVDGILTPFRHCPGIIGHRLPPSPRVTPRSPEERRRHRAERLAAYFAGAWEQSFAPAELPLHGRLPPPGALEGARGRVAALLDGRGFVLALAGVLRLHPDETVVRAPQVAREDVASLEVGTLLWDAAVGPEED